MPFKTKEELDEMRKKLHAAVWPMVTDFENKTWKQVAGTDKDTTGVVFKGQHEKIGTVWKVEANLDMTAEEYFQRFIMNAELVGWVPDLDEYKFLERNDGKGDEWSVNYSKLRSRGTVSSRDFVSIDFPQKLDDGSFICMTIVTIHPDAPKSSGSVRGEYLPSATLVRPLKDNPKRCEMFWVNNVDLKGFLPRSLVNLVMSGFMLDFGNAVIKKTKELAAAKPQ